MCAETSEIAAVKANLEEEEDRANQSAAEARGIRDECERNLALAMPAMEAAMQALETLKQNDISILKSMSNPPIGIKLVLESVCILKVRPGLHACLFA